MLPIFFFVWELLTRVHPKKENRKHLFFSDIDFKKTISELNIYITLPAATLRILPLTAKQAMKDESQQSAGVPGAFLLF